MDLCDWSSIKSFTNFRLQFMALTINTITGHGHSSKGNTVYKYLLARVHSI